MYSNFKEKAIEHIKDAVQEDEGQNFEKAIQGYMKGIEYFMTHMKYEKNSRAKEAIAAKVKEYLDRAEYLKTVVNSSTTANSGGPEGTNGTTATGTKPRPKGSDDDAEKERLRSSLGSAIMEEKPNIKWDDVAGLEHAKEALREAVILPVQFPQFFTGKRKPWSGILLYGPPGTGKSYLAKAVATEADSTFFSVSSSDLVSKWMGESEKLVSELFRLARERSPSIVFIDEVDSLCSVRGDSESEAARRIKTEFLVQMQGVNTNDCRVLVLGATNLPYNLDQAIRRRFDKRIYIPLPDAAARSVMFQVHLGDTPNNLTKADFQQLGELTEGFSGSDCNVAVKDVLMEPIRKTQEATHFRPMQVNGETWWSPCGPGEPDAIVRDLKAFAEEGTSDKVKPPDISMRDFEKVLQRARPTVAAKDLEVFEQFTKEFGEEGV